MVNQIVTAITNRPRPASTAAVADTPGPRAPMRVVRDSPPRNGEHLTFGDFLDVINPLQHIPIVSHFYRKWTGDTIKPPAELAGAMLYGGPIGLGLAAGDVALEKATGKDASSHVLALFEPENAAPTAVAADQAAPAAAHPTDRAAAAIEPAAAQPAAAEPLPPPAKIAAGNQAYAQALRRMTTALDHYQAGQTARNVSN